MLSPISFVLKLQKTSIWYKYYVQFAEEQRHRSFTLSCDLQFMTSSEIELSC